MYIKQAVLGLALLLVTGALDSTLMSAKQPCDTTCWPPYNGTFVSSELHVGLLSGSFTDADKQSIQDALSAWSATMPGAHLVFDQNCGPANNCDVNIVQRQQSGATNSHNDDGRGTLFVGSSYFGNSSESNFLTALFLHEFGHNYGFADLYGCGYGSSVMYYNLPPNLPSNQYLTGFTFSDTCMIAAGNCDVNTGAQSCAIDHNGYFDPETCSCVGQSPILLSIGDNQLQLTDARHGVPFDLNGDGAKEMIAWTQPDRQDGFLVLDRNGNGVIDNGQELFGNFTPESGGPAQGNGFRALAFFDQRSNGGNADGWIDGRDSIFSQLRMWFDLNHDGISQGSELFRLADVGVERLSLNYVRVNRRDRYGNQFTFRAAVEMTQRCRAWAWDVFFTTAK